MILHYAEVIREDDLREEFAKLEDSSGK